MAGIYYNMAISIRFVFLFTVVVQLICCIDGGRNKGNTTSDNAVNRDNDSCLQVIAAEF